MNFKDKKEEIDFQHLVTKLTHICRSSKLSSFLQLNAIMLAYKNVDDELTKEFDSTINN